MQPERWARAWLRAFIKLDYTGSPKTTQYVPAMLPVAQNGRDWAVLSQPDATTSKVPPLRLITFNHACSSPSPVHSLCLYVGPVMGECALRPRVLSHVTVILQRRHQRHILMYNLVMPVFTQATKPNIFATLTLPLSRQTVMTCLSGHRCGMAGFNLLSTGQSAFLPWPSYSGMFIQVCACLLVVCSEHQQVIGRPNIIYVKQLFNAASQKNQRGSCKPLWSVRKVLTKKVPNFRNNSLIDASL